MSRFSLHRRINHRKSAAGRRAQHRQLLLEPLEDRRLLAVFTVNSTLTLGDSFQGDGLCDTANDPTTDPPTPPSGICTLRAAAAESSDTEGNDEIKFDIEAEGVPVIESNAAFTEKLGGNRWDHASRWESAY